MQSELTSASELNQKCLLHVNNVCLRLMYLSSGINTQRITQAIFYGDKPQPCKSPFVV